MDKDNLLNDINKLIEVSRFFIYDSEDDYKKAIHRLNKLVKLIEDGKLNKVLREGSELLDDT